MSYLYLKKQNATAGQRGIVCGKTFLPLPDRTVTSSVAVTDGLEVYADGSSTTANIGTIVCSSQVTSSNGILITNSSTDETTGSVQLYGAVTESSATGNDFNGTLCLAFNFSGTLGCLVGRAPSVGLGFSIRISTTTEGDPAAAGSSTIYEIYGPNSSDSTTNTVAGSIQRDLTLWVYLFLRASETESDKLDVYLTNNPENLNKIGEIYKTYLFDVLQYEEEYRYHTAIGTEVFVGSSGSIQIRSLRLYNRRLSDAEMSNLVCELNAPEQFEQALSFTTTAAPAVGQKGLVIELPKEEMPSDGLVFHAPFDSNTTTAATGQALTFRSSGIEFGTYKGIPSVSMTRGTAAVSFPAAGLPTGNSPFTISVWFLNPSNNGQESIIIWGPESTGQMIFLNFHNGQLSLDTWFGDTSIDVENLFADEWQLLDVTYDGTTLKFYINAELVGSSAVTLGTGTASTAYIGGHPQHEFGWSGRLADLRVYNRALTELELKTLYGKYQKRRFFLPLEEAEGTPEAGATGVLLNSQNVVSNSDFYSHNSGNIPQADHVVFHASGDSLEQAESGQSFTMSGTVTLTSYKGIPGYQLSSSGKLSFPDTGFPNGGAPYTISLWAKANQSTYSESVLFMWGNLNSNGVALGYCNNTSVRDVGGNGSDHTTSSGTIVQAELNHVALSYDGQNSRIYVNGVLVSTQQISRALSLQQGVIGATHSWGEYFSGFISSIRVFDTALSDAEITELANEWTKTVPVQRAFIPIIEKNYDDGIRTDGEIPSNYTMLIPFAGGIAPTSGHPVLESEGTTTSEVIQGRLCTHFKDGATVKYSLASLPLEYGIYTVSFWYYIDEDPTNIQADGKFRCLFDTYNDVNFWSRSSVILDGEGQQGARQMCWKGDHIFETGFFVRGWNHVILNATNAGSAGSYSTDSDTEYGDIWVNGIKMKENVYSGAWVLPRTWLRVGAHKQSEMGNYCAVETKADSLYTTTDVYLGPLVMYARHLSDEECLQLWTSRKPDVPDNPIFWLPGNDRDPWVGTFSSDSWDWFGIAEGMYYGASGRYGVKAWTVTGLTSLTQWTCHARIYPLARTYNQTFSITIGGYDIYLGGSNRVGFGYNIATSESPWGGAGIIMDGTQRLDTSKCTRDMTRGHYCTLTYDGQLVRSYLDGVQIDELELPGFMFGEDGIWTVPNTRTNGLYGDVRVYPSCFTPKQVMALTTILDPQVE